MSPPEVPPKKKGKIEDLQMSSPEVQIEDLSEEKLFLRKKTMQKSTKPVHQTKDQKLSLIKNLLQKMCKKINQSESYRKKLNLVKTPTYRSLCFKNRL